VKGLDTNLLVRLITGDHPEQQARARRYVEKHCTAAEPGFVNRIVLAELIWTLKRGYGYDHHELSTVVEALLATAELEIESSSAVRSALRHFARGADFVDALVFSVNAERGCDATATFDKTAAKRLPNADVVG